MKKNATALLTALALLSLCPARAQEIPKGVNYKRTSDAVNTAASNILAKALANPERVPEALFYKVAVCGPMLWKAIKPKADKDLLDAVPLICIISTPDPITVEGKRIRTQAERQAFWRALVLTYPALRDGKVRKASADEISYFWATIPFDIEEPFLAVDAGPDRFIAQFDVTDGTPSLFWVDRVADLRMLGP